MFFEEGIKWQNFPIIAVTYYLPQSYVVYIDITLELNLFYIFSSSQNICQLRSQLINRYLFSFSHFELSISMKQHSKNYCTLSILDLHFITRSHDLCFLDRELLLKRQLLHHILIVVNLNMSFQFNGDNFILVDIIARLLIDTHISY